MSGLVERIQERLDALSLTPITAATRHGMPRDTIRNIVRKGHQPRADNLMKIAQALETTPQWLLFGDASVASSVGDKPATQFQPVSRPTGPTEGAAPILSEQPVKAGKIGQRPLALTVTSDRIRLTFDREVSPATAAKILALLEDER